MPRTARFLLDNGIYHIISRGNQKQILFVDNEDYQKYLTFLKRYKTKYVVKLYAYCLMKNHIHLVVHFSDKKSINKMMHGINMSYAKWFNYRYIKCGHVWQDRYKSFPMLKDDYLLNCLSYVEQNPVKDSICLRAEEYPWSSYRARLLGEKDSLIDALSW